MLQKSLTSRDGLKITYFVHRHKEKKPSLFFIHSYTTNYTMFSRQYEFFQKDFNIFAVDIRGHGKSGKSTKKCSFSLEKFASDIRAIFDREKIKSATLIGVSLGGIISLKCSETLKGRIDSLVIISSSYNFLKTTTRPFMMLEKVISRIKVRDPFFYRKKWFSKYIPDRSSFYLDFSKLKTENLRKEAFIQFSKSIDKDSLHSLVLISKQMITWDVMHIVEKIRIPCLFLAGADDTFVRPLAACEMAALIPGSELRVIANANHDLILQKPDTVSRIMDAFLKRVYKI
ncbi:MAG: alpha/beta hydrolase [Candidatus Woesearchaeota archaeon]